MDRHIVSELYKSFATGAVLAFNQIEAAAPTLILLRVREGDGAVEDSYVLDCATVNGLQLRGTLHQFVAEALTEEGLPGLAANVVIHIAEGRMLGLGEEVPGLLVAIHTRDGCRVGICPIHEMDDRRSAEFRPMDGAVWHAQSTSTCTYH